jgi:hypothetical protein
VKKLTGLFGVLGACCLIGDPAAALSPEETRRWQQDIEFYKKTLEERHINLYHTVGKKRFHAALERLTSKLPELNEQQVVFEMMRITRLVGDGHTQFPIMAGPHRHFPFRFRLFGDDVRVAESSKAHREYLGHRVTAIDGTPISRVLESISPAVQPVENDYSLMASLAFHLTVENMLFAAGVIQDPGSATFSLEDDAGNVHSVTVRSLVMHDYITQTTSSIGRKSPFPDPELVHSDKLWMTKDGDTRTAYLYFSAYPSLEEMAAFGEQVSAYLGRHRIRNIVIDLRDNGGGDFYVGLTLSSPILMTDSIDWNEGVYVLIGRHTYSAAMSNAVQFRQILNARLVGEPTGGNPVSYSELGWFDLPNSNRTVLFSERYYRFQADDSPGVQPDVPVELTPGEFIAGSDAVLEWVMRDVRRRTPVRNRPVPPAGRPGTHSSTDR